MVIETGVSTGIRDGEACNVDVRALALALWGQWKGCASAMITDNTARFSRTLEQVQASALNAILTGLLSNDSRATEAPNR